MIDFVKQITKEAGKMLLSASSRITAQKAGGGNWVTEADLASEKHIMGAIQKNFPSHAILSEETAPTLAHPEKLPHLWVIDPLDGTTNFTYGIPLFCVSVAYMEHGKVVAGAIYDPMRENYFRLNVAKVPLLTDRASELEIKKHWKTRR